MPCAFEWLGEPGAPQDAELGGEYCISGGDCRFGLAVEPPSSAFKEEDHWASRAAAEAAKVGAAALRMRPDECSAAVARAFAACPDAGDAWTARGLRNTSSHEEALACFVAGSAAARRALAPALLSELSESHGLTTAQLRDRKLRTPWLVHPALPVVRAMAVEAAALRKLGRWAEAADAVEQLHAFDAGTHVDISFWCAITP